MSGGRSRTRLLAVIALPTVLLAACGSGKEASDSTTTTKGAPTTSTATTTPAKAAGSSAGAPTSASAPEVGDCLEPMTQPIAGSHQLPAIVPCDGPHGGEVVSVLEIPPPTDDTYPGWGRNLEGADEQVSACEGDGDAPGQLTEFLGSAPLTLTDAQVAKGAFGAYAVTGIQYATFIPGPAAWQAGERWLACSAVLSNRLKVPSSYTGTLKGALAKPGSLDEQFSWCKQQPPDSRDTFTVVPCSEPHNYEQLASYSAGSNDTQYPGDEALGALAEELCPVLSSQATGKRSDDLPDGIGLGWTYPLEYEWSNGDRAVRCFAVTEDGDSTGGIGMGTAKLAS